MAISPSVRVNVTGARGESQADILRRTGRYGVVPTDTDDQAMGKLNAAAELAAATAESAAGPTYPNTSAGLAATTDGGAFAVDNGDGTVTVYLNQGGTAVEQRTLATTAALAADGAPLIGLALGGTLADAIKYVTPEMFGAVGDDVANDLPAWNLMHALMPEGAVIDCAPKRRYRLTGTLNISKACTLNMNGSVLVADHDGLGLSADPINPFGAFNTRRGYKLDLEIAIEKGGARYALGSKGFLVVNLTCGILRQTMTQGFELAGELLGTTRAGAPKGFDRNNIYLGDFTDNSYGLVLTDDVGANWGWITENNFYGGSFNGEVNPSPGNPLPGSFWVHIVGNANGNSNNNRFFGPCFQGWADCGAIIGGVSNGIFWPRFEMPQATDYWRFKAGSQSNQIELLLIGSTWPERFGDDGLYNYVKGIDQGRRFLEYYSGIFYPRIAPGQQVFNPVAGRRYAPVGGEATGGTVTPSGGAVTIDLGTGAKLFRINANADVSSIIISNRPSTYDYFKLAIQQGASGQSVTGFPSGFNFGRKSAPPVSRAFGLDVYELYWEPSTSTWNVVSHYASGTRPTIANPTGGATIDAEARTSITAILNALRNAGLVN